LREEAVTFPYVVRSLLAVADGWLAITILATIVWQHRHQVHDYGQDWRFVALAAWCLVPIFGLRGRWHADLTWGTWAAVAATVITIPGVLAIRHQQRRR
jgi:hypothetical protein